MDQNELIEKRKDKLKELESIFSSVKLEKRKLSNVEDVAFNKVKDEIDELDKQIEEKRNIKNNKINIRKMENKFRLTKLIEARLNHTSLDEYAEILEAGKKEMRKTNLECGDMVLPMDFRSDILAGTQYQGQEIVTEDKWSLLGPLRDKLVLTLAGANLITGLVGDVSIPVYAGTSAAWKGETTIAADGAGAFSEVTLSPKRLTAYIDVSKQFLVQDSISADQLLMNDMVNAVTDKLQKTLLGSASGNTEFPGGIFYGQTEITGATGAWGTLVAMEQSLEESSTYGPYSFILSPSAKAFLKSNTGSTAYNTILMGNELMGYQYQVTNAVEYGHLAFANWSDMIIAQWGGIDLTIDPYTVAHYGKIRLVINTYWDGKFRRGSYRVADIC